MKELNLEFPCYLYHAEFGARVFCCKDEIRDAGNGWVDSPAKLVIHECPGKKYLSLEDLKVKELKELLINDFKVDESSLKQSKKDDLIKMIKELKGE